MTETNATTANALSLHSGRPLGEVFDTVEAANRLLKIRVEYWGIITAIPDELTELCWKITGKVVVKHTATAAEDLRIRRALHDAQHQAFMADREALQDL